MLLRTLHALAYVVAAVAVALGSYGVVGPH